MAGVVHDGLQAYDEGGLRLEREELVGVEPELGEDSSQLLHDLHPPPELAVCAPLCHGPYFGAFGPGAHGRVILPDPDDTS